MAQLIKTVADTPAAAPPPPSFITIDIRLSYEEARALRDVLWKVGGHPRTTRRYLTDNIGEVLNDVLLPHGENKPNDMNGSTYFERQTK